MGKNSNLSENKEEGPSTSVVGAPLRERVNAVVGRAGKRSRWDQDKKKKQ